MENQCATWAKAVLALVFLAFPSVATAESGAAPTVLDTLLQSDAEERMDFLRRVAQTFRSQTESSGHEVGGYLCSNEQGQLGMFMATSSEPMYVQPIFGCPLDTPNLTWHFIHTHPKPGFRRAKVLGPNEAPRRQLTYMSSMGQRRFSTSDYALGPGYVVAGRYLIHQEGRGTECLVLDLEDPSAIQVRVARHGKIMTRQPCQHTIPGP